MKYTESRNSLIKELIKIPGVGKSIANDLIDIGITKVSDLKGRNPEVLYHKSNIHAGTVQDKCLLYSFRCAVYYASHKTHKPGKIEMVELERY